MLGASSGCNCRLRLAGTGAGSVSLGLFLAFFLLDDAPAEAVAAAGAAVVASSPHAGTKTAAEASEPAMGRAGAPGGCATGARQNAVSSAAPGRIGSGAKRVCA